MINWEHQRILVTRPAQQAQGLINLLSSKGAGVLLFPTLVIHPVTDIDRLKKDIQQHLNADWFMFISPNAVAHVMPLMLEAKWLSGFEGQFATVGGGTRDLLAHYGVNNIVCPLDEVGAQALLDTLETEEVNHQRVVIFKGDSENPILEEGLSKRGAHVFPITCYQRQRTQDDPEPLLHALSNGRIDVIVTSSGDGLQSLIQILPATLQSIACQLPVVVVSKRIRDMAKNFGFSKIILAKDTSDEAITLAIEQWYEQGASHD
jgi:uroporphyrinogen-III synthase